MKAEAARKIALRYYNEVQQGKNPKAANEAERVLAANTFGDLARRYLEFKKSGKKPLRPRSYVEVARHLEVYAKPFHKLPVASIDRHMVEDCLNRVAKNATKGDGAVTANRLHASLSAMFTWAMRKELAPRNPVISVDKHEERSRDRTLSDTELKAIWEALASDNYGTILKLLLLTAARLNEIAGLKWSEVNFDRNMIELPATRVKNGRAHLIPMSGTVREILEGHSRIEGGELVFSTGVGSQFSAWSKSKADLDERLAGKVTGHWTTHDLRRTAATRMAEDLKIQPHVIESLLNHAGHSSSLARTYNRAQYLTERTQALDLWADHIAAVLAGRKSNITPLRAPA
jgi:integrase